MATHKSLVIHNVMEDSVLRIVDEICDEDAASENPKYCTSNECRMDAACYVLNRVPQRYVTSARGQAHMELELGRDKQLYVDLVALAHEGLRRVSSFRRSFYNGEHSQITTLSGPQFYLPTIKGRFFNGASFSLVTDVEVSLLRDDETVPMIDSRWQNPYAIVGNTAGTYLFWPAPIPAENDGERRTFEFEIRVEASGYDEFHHYFTIDRLSVGQVPEALEMAGEHRLPDLYLVPTT
ncbi:MAG: late competence development ComFB family protein [Spirochaetota bacterium]